METVEEHPVINSTIDDMKTTVTEELPTNDVESDVCQKSNGVNCITNSDDNVAESTTEVESVPNSGPTVKILEICENFEIEEPVKQELEEAVVESAIDKEIIEPKSDIDLDNEDPKKLLEVTEPEIVDENVTVSSDQVVIADENAIDKQEIGTENNITEHSIENEIQDQTTIERSIIDQAQVCDDKNQNSDLELGSTVEFCASSTTINEGVHFETEILIEKNDNDVNENVIIESETLITDNSNNILSELGENIELSDVLQSSDMTSNVENNNATAKEEVFNKEELLDILQGNDVDQSYIEGNEAEKALQQLSMLKQHGRSTKKVKNKSKESVKNKDNKSVANENVENKVQEKDNIVNVLVMDWDDDEPENKDHQDSESLPPDSDKKCPQNIEPSEEPSGRSSVESTVSEDTSQKQVKSEDESPPKRLGRVIKKKVIFDPDNPDTFTKSKTPSKSKEVHQNKDQPPIKKGKIEHTPQRNKSRSPTSKLQWKKPSPRNSKQNKRLSEVDKLLMDEGAVNMIYQLTPEAPKGRKNVKTKAEFIKKIQSSTPEGKEMKFRERKKDARYDDGDAKKILGGKQRSSLSSSVKSPSVCEDFETHSADDSIIYRRHSSSSYSSSCMSPRRLSDVEGNSQSSKPAPVPQTEKQSMTNNHNDTQSQSEDIFMLDVNTVTSDVKTELINKEDCLSIKEKLNSKLSLALNKRKRDSAKVDKPAKQKKILKPEEKEVVNEVTNTLSCNFKFVSVKIDQHLAEICLQKTGSKDSVEVLKELEQALKSIDENNDISVTLLSSQCGTLCSSLDLSLLLDENSEIRTKNAYELAESVRSLLATVSRHRKLVCCGVWGACSGAWVALVALCDVALASECATFSLAAPAAPSLPGAAALAAPHRALPHPLVNDLVIFGRRISASEALRGGLVSRTLWPFRFDEQVRNIVKDIAIQPTHAVLLKKRLLGLKKSREGEVAFLSCLESERDLLVEYWTSVEGQELLRAALDAA
ncbi:muscle M-line assembly protein unc-89 [Zerene cesonia]|uniref:muscle M-line assembly protein unc-89 n=1 Tax=Zerene cesonia TaxID=33412 RepID=UPI0018E5010A|nr:muscle M-line assembly protein unc-89 [Zerene cesonia]